MVSLFVVVFGALVVVVLLVVVVVGLLVVVLLVVVGLLVVVVLLVVGVGLDVGLLTFNRLSAVRQDSLKVLNYYIITCKLNKSDMGGWGEGFKKGQTFILFLIT